VVDVHFKSVFYKYIKIIFFLKKIIFNINTFKRSKNIKIIILS
jgi:hypothetical protein